MAEVDRKVPEEHGITISRMMENAGLLIAEFLRQEVKEESFTFYAGKGNNGGDALAAARRMHLWNYDVEVVLASEELEGIREEELEILKKLGVEITLESSKKIHKIAVEGLIGYNLKGDPRPPFDSMIHEINGHETVVSVDIASSLDADTGERSKPCVRSDFTVTLAARFNGMTAENFGRIFVADIGVPPEAFDEFGFTGDFFLIVLWSSWIYDQSFYWNRWVYCPYPSSSNSSADMNSSAALLRQ